MVLPHISGHSTARFGRLLVVIKQTAYEEYTQLKLRGQAPKALRWKRLENRYKAHKNCVTELLWLLRRHDVKFNCVNRAELDRQHLSDVDLVVAVGGDGTVLSAAHFLDHGTIPLLGINSDPISAEQTTADSVKKKVDERRSHGALCMCTSTNMTKLLPRVLYGGGTLSARTRIQCIVKSTFSETKLVPALNDLLIANPSPAAVSRFRMGWLEPVVSATEDTPPLSPAGAEGGGGGSFTEFFRGINDGKSNGEHLSELRAQIPSSQYGTVTRFGGVPYDITRSLNVWSSGMWVCTGTGSTAAMHAAGGQEMALEARQLQYLVREHMIEHDAEDELKSMNNQILQQREQLHLRWNSQRGRIFIDGSHLMHNLELGDEILINNQAPPLLIFSNSQATNTADTFEQDTANAVDKMTQ